MADSAEAIIFISRTGIDVNPDARERARQRFASDTYSIFEGCDLVEIGGVLYI
jgi:hypothetical protein